jgi:hypothetical protein
MLQATEKKRKLDDPLAFMMAGNAYFTLVSKKTEVRFTYRVALKKKASRAVGPFWVSVLTGSDNTRDYTFIGTIFAVGGRAIFRFSKKSHLTHDAKSVVAFEWTTERLTTDGKMPSEVEVYHAGRCGRCGRKLTVPESIESGYGPECIQLIGGA